MHQRLALVSCVLTMALVAGGCSPGRGKYTSEALQKAQDRVSGMKAANEYQQSWQAYTAGDLEKAFKGVERSLTLNPNVAKSWVLRGRIQIEQGALEQALESFQKAEALEPTSVDAQYYQGIVHERFSQPAEALVKYQKAAELEPTNAQYAIAAAEMMMDLGQYAEAEQFLTTRTASFQHNAGIRQTLGHVALLQGDSNKAAELFGEARLLAPDDTSVLEDLVHAQVATGKFADAEYNIVTLLKVPENKDRRDLMHIRARCLMELDRAVDARQIYVELTAGDAGQRDLEAWIGLGNTSYVLRDQLRLRQASARVVALAPDRPEGYVLRAWLQLRGTNPQDALGSLDKAIERRGDDVEPLLLKALVLKQLGRLDEADAVLAQAAIENPNHPGVRQTVTSEPTAGQGD